MTARTKSSLRVEDVNLPDDGPTYDQPSMALDAIPNEPADPNIPVAMAGHHQQRAMAAALRDHGITTDAAVYDYLTAALGREITSRKELTTTEAAHIIRELIDNPPAQGPTVEQWAALAAPFPPDQVEKKPQTLRRDDQDKGRCENNRYSADGHFCGGWHARAIHLDYVGHAGITMRLNEVVTPAGWSWEPVAFNPDGTPNTGREFWIRLTVLGVTKYGVGDDFNGSAKQAIGDALRNAALRFGIATYLWSKSDASKVIAAGGDPDAHQSAPGISRDDAARGSGDASSYPGPVTDDLSELGTADLLLIVDGYAEKAGVSFEKFTEKFRTEIGLGTAVPVDEMDTMPPDVVAGFVRRVRNHLAQTGASA